MKNCLGVLLAVNRIPRINISILALMLADVLLINGALFLGLSLGFYGGLSLSRMAFFEQVAPWVSLMGLVLLTGFGVYEQQPREMRAVLWPAVLVGLEVAFVPTAISRFSGQQALSPKVWLPAGGTAFLLLSLWRWLQVKMLWLPVQGRNRLLVIGEKKEAIRILAELLKGSTHRHELKGYVEPKDTGALQQSLAKVDSILMVPGMAPEIRNRVVATCLDQGKTVFVIPDQESGMFYNSRRVRVGDKILLQLDRKKIMDSGKMKRKR